MEGATQLIVWWKILEVQDSTSNSFYTTVTTGLDSTNNVTSAQVVRALNKTVTELFGLYPVTYTSTLQEVDSIFQRLGNISDSLWNDNSVTEEDPLVKKVVDLVGTLVTTVMNSVFAQFKIDPLEGDGVKIKYTTLDELQHKVMEESAEKFNLVVSSLDLQW